MIKTFTIRRAATVTVCVAAVLVAAATLISTPVYADTVVTRSTKVSYAGIDLSSPAGQKIMQHRLQHAANKVCAYPDTAQHALADRLAQLRCITGAMSKATMHLAVATKASPHASRVAISAVDDAARARRH